MSEKPDDYNEDQLEMLGHASTLRKMIREKRGLLGDTPEGRNLMRMVERLARAAAIDDMEAIRDIIGDEDDDDEDAGEEWKEPAQ